MRAVVNPLDAYFLVASCGDQSFRMKLPPRWLRREKPWILAGQQAIALRWLAADVGLLDGFTDIDARDPRWPAPVSLRWEAAPSWLP